MGYLALLLLLRFFPVALTTSNPCQDFALNECAGDDASIIFEINTGEVLCEQYCFITPGCSFFRYDSRPVQGISCALFDEPFSVYAGHCNELSAPKEFANLENCLAPAPDSCDIIQEGNCAFWGTLEESMTLANVNDCAILCEVLTCDYWIYQRESKQCLIHSNPNTDKNRKCNVVFGPKDLNGTCHASPQPTVTPDTEFKTTPEQTAEPDFCNRFPDDDKVHTVEDEKDCGCYWQCFQGEASHQCCTHCFLYYKDENDENSIGICTNRDDPNFGGCEKRPNDTNCDPAPSPGLCPYPDGYFKDNRTCDHFFICHYDEPHSMKCQNQSEGSIVEQQLLYNYEGVMCDWQDRVDCDVRPICQTIFFDEEEQTYNYTHCRCQGASTFPPEDFSCPPSELGIYGDPFNCQKYYFCKDGVIVEQDTCLPNEFWDEDAKYCIPEGKCKGRPVCEDIVNTDLCFCSHQ